MHRLRSVVSWKRGRDGIGCEPASATTLAALRRLASEGTDERVAGIMPVKTETPEKRTKSTRIPTNPNDYIMAATGMKIKKKPDENKS